MSQDGLKEHLRRLANATDSKEKLPTEPQPVIKREAFQKFDMNSSTVDLLGRTEESLSEKPPPPPPKSPQRSIQRPREKEPIGLEEERFGSHFDYSDDEQDAQSTDGRSRHGSIQEKRSTTDSSEIKMAFSVSTINLELNKTMQPTIVAINPLALAPVSPGPPITQVPRMPKRPARPLSLRFSAFPRMRGLTTSRVLMVDPDKKMVSESYSTQPHTGYITAASKGAPIKYGRGKYATTELIPQPSDDPQDPLNWQTWRKDLHFYALLTTVALCNVMKTALVSANGPLASTLSVSYTAVAALTGVPLMLSACTGLASSAAAKIWGRRPVYLASMVLLFIGIVWNTAAKTSYGQFMAARIFQGFGWGAFDTIVIGSIMDTHFEHERNIKKATYRIVSVATTWGPPLLGGLVVQHPVGVTLQFEILAIFQIFSIPLLVLGVPETTYDRMSNMFEKPTPGWTPRTGWSMSSIGLKSSSRFRRLPAWARGRGGITLDRAVQYVRDVAPPVSYQGAARGYVDRALLLQALRAAAAPTTVLAFLTSLLPFALLWGLAASLSGLFAREPYDLCPATVGSLLATPFVLATAAVALFSLWSDWSKTGRAFRIWSSYLLVLGAGTALSLIGILGFALYVAAARSRAVGPADQGLRFSALSFILGLLAAGACVLDAPTKLLIQRSAQFTSPNLCTILRNASDMDAGVAAWRALAAGVFAVGVPAAVVASDAGLRSTGVGVAVVHVLVAVGVGAAWYWRDESIRRLDGRVLACVDLTPLRSPRSFFEDGD